MSQKPATELIKKKIGDGVGKGVFPGIVLLVSHKNEILFHEGMGHTSLKSRALPIDKHSIFDLASLTKPLATSLAFMKLLDMGKIGLDEPLSTFFQDRPLKEKAGITPRSLLCHSSGFEAWQPFYLELEQYDPRVRKTRLREILLSLPLGYNPGEACLYSDLGFIMLEWLLEIASGLSLDRFTRKYLYEPLAIRSLFFIENNKPLPVDRDTIAATEYCPWRKRTVQGEVHDENAHVLGGYSGHAGLFGTARDVLELIRCLKEHFYGKRKDLFETETVRSFFSRQDVIKDCTWALGWDTPSRTNSSSGKYFSPKSVGHLGFTGTSIWVDLEKDVTVILLTNRIHPDRNNIKIRKFRPEIHDLIMETLI